MSIDDCRIIELPKITDLRGNLSVIEGGVQIPFDIKRVYYLYDVPGGSSRAGHGHKELQQLIVAMSGSFDVIVDDGFKRRKFQLNRSYFGLYIPKGMWREVENFSSGGVCLVLASTIYDPLDYFHDYEDFRDFVRSGK
ncbi:FdtA/QdtA family cupin domain-containing protein [Polynucleobacter sp. JS-Polo-80-F4]|uniref:sugar 3,4-ketoisomerase n=1 Tax=Polynucleobacter sp. JS-Polo-80-F4 TaxID=2576918 RepID=UPI001C0AC336|nr:FdtA/QdtA family cupin domain-containing protein [Polynucleobacter sp. JS-Polo-80-F4]MBU3616741.1 WxcM-like domain-containing protein [Polynucleobacter sp. JS-Polo-80-F4]